MGTLPTRTCCFVPARSSSPTTLVRAGPLPQAIRVAFNPPLEEKVATKSLTSAGVCVFETLEEFAALLAVFTRRRVFVRWEDGFYGQGLDDSPCFHGSNHQEPQRTISFDENAFRGLLRQLVDMPRELAEAFMSAVRLYGRALETLYTQPQMSYLLLVMALEAVSCEAVPTPSRDERCARLDAQYPKWRGDLEGIGGKRRNRLIVMLLRADSTSFYKLNKFVKSYLPSSFWSARVDNAKPVFADRSQSYSRLAFGARLRVPDDPLELASYERFRPVQLETKLLGAYSARSKFVHTGRRLPETITLGLSPDISDLAAAQYEALRIDGKDSGIPDLPTLLTLERLVSCTLVNFLERGHPRQNSERGRLATARAGRRRTSVPARLRPLRRQVPVLPCLPRRHPDAGHQPVEVRQR